ncbi:unnamed protein product [[Actinomadura] parvosata subsp. kistnae]|uniref:Uncharacterized protein n=1 Tax=[Actinomadura] parvosata subsp. kistnae TaxID=1909395 RepID=A0A1U9ZZG8_9ACTN|nr:hypothetical protein [Nonomuraea sp. ATCC 55076]AQZ63351.1 hypothetical protein BKM31_19475 [Nonomuraea sp. ATCC 55076]SPL99059.1 unnamed protein product [Actinomadura parvosata subsp. kistnae]
MRRHRFGRLAAGFAALYLAAVIVLAVVGLAGGDFVPLWRVVADPGGYLADDIGAWPWLPALLVPIAAVQAWAYREVLRGRPREEPARHGREVRLLRVALYAMAGYVLTWRLPIPYLWWTSPVAAVIELVAIWLFFRVLRSSTRRWPRVLMLVTGTLSVVHDIATTVAYQTGTFLFAGQDWTWALDALWSVWLVSLLVAQARDPRWSGATVRAGVLAVLFSLLSSGSMSIVALGSSDAVPWKLLIPPLLGAVSVFSLVWWARSAHDLGTLQPPSHRTEPVRARARWWPLPAVAIVLPLVPAAVNLARGVPFWLGPKNVLGDAVREYTGSQATAYWVALDLLVGVGAPAVLILIAVRRRTRTLLRATTLTLFLLGGAGAVSAFTSQHSTFFGELWLYPESLYLQPGATVPYEGAQLLSPGISPLWYALALTASGLLLLLLYAAPPAHRVRHHVLLAGLAAAVALCLLPAADLARGPATDCVLPEPWEIDMGEAEPRELTAEQKFVCSLRGNSGAQAVLHVFPDTTPDQVVLAYGRRLCGVHTRNDPRELARLKIDRASLTYPLAGICPSAATIVQAAKTRQDQEIAAMQADSQAMCDATPRHRPRIKPARAIRMKEPQWTDYGVLQTYEGGEEEETEPDMDPGNGLVSSARGTLAVMTHPDFDLCVTLETYTRRPPVETKGWDKVVEVGYDSPGGEIVFVDTLSGTELPNLALNGRKGHYRIRVHYAWFPWKGEAQSGQRLLIMAYPGKGDKELVYRK